MPKRNLVRAALNAPLNYHVDHPNLSAGVVYTCHMAALHWACMAHGDTPMQAHEKVSAYTRKHCPGCNNLDRPHASVSTTQYSKDFCSGGLKVSSPDELKENCMSGDILTVGPAAWVSHTMIVRRRSKRSNRVYIRGFNNHGTFMALPPAPLPPRDAYDPVSRDVTDSRLWNGAPFSIGGDQLSVIRHHVYMNRVKRKLG